MLHRSHRFLEHTADLGIEASGPDLLAALDQAVAGLALLLAGHKPEGTPLPRAIEVHGPDLESLLVGLLGECLFLLEAEDWLAQGVSEIHLTEEGLAASLLGQPVHPSALHEGTPVKAITYHQLAILQDEDGVRLTVFVDL